jgi:putative transcriptional regulator
MGNMTSAVGAISNGINRPLRRPGIPKVDQPSADHIDVAAIRKSAGYLGATQRTFANVIGVPVKTLRNWEQRRRKPTGPALVLLSLIQRDPWIVFDVVNGQHRTPVA